LRGFVPPLDHLGVGDDAERPGGDVGPAAVARHGERLAGKPDCRSSVSRKQVFGDQVKALAGNGLFAFGAGERKAGLGGRYRLGTIGREKALGPAKQFFRGIG